MPKKSHSSQISSPPNKHTRRWIIALVLIFAVSWATLLIAIQLTRPSSLPTGIALIPVNTNEEYPSWLYYQLAPGDSVTDSFWLWNGYDFKVDLTLGSLDAKDSSTLEHFTLKSEYEDVQTTIGVWATPGYSIVTLEPQTAIEIPFTLSVPENTESKEYWGALFADYSTGDDGPIRTVIQTGLRIILIVDEHPNTVPTHRVEWESDHSPTLLYPFLISVMITLTTIGIIGWMGKRNHS